MVARKTAAKPAVKTATAAKDEPAAGTKAEPVATPEAEPTQPAKRAVAKEQFADADAVAEAALTRAVRGF